LFCSNGYRFPDPPVHPIAFSVSRSDTWWTVVPKKAAAVAETSTIIQLKRLFFDEFT